MSQPPSGGCVLKLCHLRIFSKIYLSQPPSGGCVLKPNNIVLLITISSPAAFRRLCVETAEVWPLLMAACSQPPSGGCVLKPRFPVQRKNINAPAAFRRLCVETIKYGFSQSQQFPAAFRRLCVETHAVSGLISSL